MNLFLLRHAIAVERGTPGYADDSKRPLTPRGRQKMLLNVLGLRALDLAFDVILTSPYLRAKQTASIVAQAFKIGAQQMVLTKNLIPDASFKDLLAEINSHGDNGKTILLVGHEPQLSDFISFLLIGHQGMPLSLKKGGICHLRISTPAKTKSATLEWILTPAQLRHMKH